MNKLTEDINIQLSPQAALIAYADKKNNSYFLELRNINKTGKMGTGRPVTVEFLDSLFAGFSETHNTIASGIVPKNLLFCDTRPGFNKFIWYNSPRKRMMYFTKSLNMENTTYNMPGVIYSVCNETMKIYAYKGDDPTPDTELYAAPFFNIYDRGVCFGSSKLDKPLNLTFLEILEYWEKKFWASEFSHLGENGNPTKSNLILVTKAAKNSEFNYKELKSLNMNLKEILT